MIVNLAEEENLLKTLRAVLTGKTTRNKASELPPRALAFIGIALMLTRWEFHGRAGSEGYVLSTALDRKLDVFLRALVLTGTSREMEGRTDACSHVARNDLRIAAQKLGLYVTGPIGGQEPIKLEPSARLEELVAAHGDHPAVQTFFNEVAENSPSLYWKLADRPAFDLKEGQLRLSANELLDQFEVAHGAPGLKMLYAQLEERLRL